MDDPVQDISSVIHTLVQGSPKEQEQAINKYFTPNASFTHPFCRTGSFEGSRMLIHYIYQWYKVMSPKVEMKINGIAYDEKNMTLYVNLSQVFAIWAVPFHRSPVTLTTQLQLTHPPNSKKYYIKSQNDLYQVNQFVRFFAPWGIGDAVILLWHAWATFFCVIGVFLFTPFIRLQQSYADSRTTGRETNLMSSILNIEDGRTREGQTDAQAQSTVRENATEFMDGIADDLRDRRRLDDGEVGRLMEFGSEGNRTQQDQKDRQDQHQQQFGTMQVIT